MDEDEIKNIENMIFRRNLQEVMALINRPMGHEIRECNGVETFMHANVIDVSSTIPFHGMLTEWSMHAQNPGAISLQVHEKAPAHTSLVREPKTLNPNLVAFMLSFHVHKRSLNPKP